MKKVVSLNLGNDFSFITDFKECEGTLLTIGQRQVFFRFKELVQ